MSAETSPLPGHATDRYDTSTFAPQPDQRLDPRAIRVWQIGELIGWGVTLLMAAVVIGALDRFTDLSRLWLGMAGGVVLAFALLNIIWIPHLRWRRWAYRVGDIEVDLERGWWTITRTRIPMARIQHVDMRRSPLQRRYGLASVILYTAAGASEIPALADPVASSVRDRIASLANTRDDV